MAGEKQINFIWSHLVPLWKIIKVFLNCLFSSFGWNKLILEIPDLRIWQIYPFFAALEFSILIHVREIIFLACKTGRRFCSRSSLPQVFLRKGVMKICSKFTGKHQMPKCDFNKVAKQLYWNHISAWVFSCKFAPYFQNNFSWEHLWMAAVAVSKQDCCYGLLRTYLDHQIMSNKWIPKEKPLNCLPEIKKTLRAIFYLNLAYEYLFYN